MQVVFANDAAWTGAEKSLLNGTSHRVDSIPTAKDYCRLFLTAAKYAAEYDTDEDEDEDDDNLTEELGVDLPLRLMNIRGVTEESIPKDPLTEEEEDAFFANLTARTSNQEEIQSEASDELTMATKEYDHEIFVRASREKSDGTYQIIGQGFVKNYQPFVWHVPMEQQKFILHLDDPGLGVRNTPEFQNLEAIEKEEEGEEVVEVRSTTARRIAAVKFANAFRFTIGAVFKKDSAVRLVRRTGPNGGSEDPNDHHDEWYETTKRSLDSRMTTTWTLLNFHRNVVVIRTSKYFRWGEPRLIGMELFATMA